MEIATSMKYRLGNQHLYVLIPFSDLKIAASARLLAWVHPVAGLVVNWAGSSYERHLDDRGNVFFGGFADASGITGLGEAIESGDPFAIAMSSLEVMGSLAAVGQLARAGGTAARQMGRAAATVANSPAGRIALKYGVLSAAAVGAGNMFLFGGGVQEAEAGYPKAIAQAARTASSLARRAWSLGNGERGLLLEIRRLAQLGAGKLPKNFEVFDHFAPMTRTATSIKSLDLLSAFYQSPKAILSRGKSIVNAIWAFQYARRGNIVLASQRIVKRNLDLIVPYGATAEQLAVLERVVQYGRTLRVHVRIITR